jgi:ribose transport system substrate-binding protein
MKKKTLVRALALLGAVMLPLAAHADAKGKKVAYFDAGPTHPFVAAVNKAFNERAKELGMEVTQFDTPYDPALQSQQVDDAIARKFDMLAIIAASQKAIVPALNRAKQAGIPVMIVNNGIVSGVEDLYVSEIGEDNHKLGKLAAESVMKALKDSGRAEAKIALITGVLSEGVARDRADAFSEALKANPGYKIVATEDAFWDTAKSEQIASQLFARFAPEGGLDAIVGWADNQTAAIIRAAEAAGIALGTEKGKLIVVGTNCTPDSAQLIKDGKEYSTGLQAPVRTGKKAAEMIADYFDGKTLPKFEELPVMTLTKDNLGDWEASCTY